MTRIEANKMTKPQLAEALAARKTKNVTSRSEWAKAYLRHTKGYLVALMAESTTRKNSKEYPAVKLALQEEARRER